MSLRRKRCEACRKAEHARVMRERRATESGHELDEHVAYDEVIDYTKGGHRPPVVDVVQKPPREEPREQPISDGRVESPALRQQRRELDYSNVPGWVRQDRVRAAQMAAAQHRPPVDHRDVAPDGRTWGQYADDWNDLRKVRDRFGMAEKEEPYRHPAVFLNDFNTTPRRPALPDSEMVHGNLFYRGSR